MVVNVSNVSTILEYFEYGETGVGAISTNGSATGYATTSDARLKLHDGAISAEHAGGVIDKLEPLWFKWKSDPDGASSPGFFAQDVHQHFPHAVTKVFTNEESGKEVPWMMDQAKLMPVVIAELQTLRKRIAELEQRCCH